MSWGCESVAVGFCQEELEGKTSSESNRPVCRQGRSDHAATSAGAGGIRRKRPRLRLGQQRRPSGERPEREPPPRRGHHHGRSHATAASHRAETSDPTGATPGDPLRGGGHGRGPRAGLSCLSVLGLRGRPFSPRNCSRRPTAFLRGTIKPANLQEKPILAVCRTYMQRRTSKGRALLLGAVQRVPQASGHDISHFLECSEA